MRKGFVRYLVNVASGHERGFGAWCLMPSLWMASLFYGGVVALVRGLYQTGIFKVFHVPVPVISIGNITAGGTGKTPFVVMLYRILKQEGFHPMVLTRGYMGGQGGVSDEAEMLKELIGPRVFVGADRMKTFQAAYTPGQFDCVILDDGFQQWGLWRDLDIVLVDSERPFGNGLLIPGGILREAPLALCRAGAVVFTRADRISSEALDGLQAKVKSLAPAAIFAQGIHQVSGARDAFDGEKIPLADVRGAADAAADAAAGALCAIGAPESFRRTLEGLGLDVKLFTAFEDHYRFTAEDAADVVAQCRARGVERVFITHKDADKLKAFRDVFRGIKVIIIDIEFTVTYGKTDIVSSIRRLRRS